MDKLKEFNNTLRHKELQEARIISWFDRFVYSNNLSWHKHDGWLQPYDKGELSLTWIGCHRSSHSALKPKAGDKIAITDKFPNTESPFELNIYKVDRIEYGLNEHLILKFIEKKQVFFNEETGEFQWHKEKKSWLKKLITRMKL